MPKNRALKCRSLLKYSLILLVIRFALEFINPAVSTVKIRVPETGFVDCTQKELRPFVKSAGIGVLPGAICFYLHPGSGRTAFVSAGLIRH